MKEDHMFDLKQVTQLVGIHYDGKLIQFSEDQKKKVK